MRGLERIAADRRHLIAAQVRCSTGFTQGVIRAEGSEAVVPALRPRNGAAATVAAPVAAEATAVLAARVAWLAELLRGWPEGEALPAPGELAEKAWMAPGHDPHVAGHRLVRAFAALEAAGVLRTIAGSREGFRGQRVVLLCDSGRVLRTAGAPAEWDDQVRAQR